MKQKNVYTFNADFGRQGILYGLFLATASQIEELLNHDEEIYLGEVLGKHSEVELEIESEHIDLVTDDQAVVSVIEQYGLENGINPLKYFNQED